jgi:hypothetical protein
MARLVAPESFTDISLEAWADYRAKELIAQGKITPEWYYENSRRVLQAPRLLGGSLLFNAYRNAGARINYNAVAHCQLSHANMAALEELLAEPAEYFS